jgi:hypothetical protein
MHKSVEEILKDISNLPIESREILIMSINKMLPNKQEENATLLEFRKDIQEKIRFACPYCGCDNIVGHGNFKGRKDINATIAKRPLMI